MTSSSGAVKAWAGGALFTQLTQPGLDRLEVIGLHGWGRDRSDLLGCLDGYRAMVVDLPGFGRSPAPDDVWGAREYADFLADELVKKLTDGPIVAVGHSFGGRVALCLAARHPDLVKGLVLMGTPLLRAPSTSRPSVFYRLIRTLTNRGIVPSRYLDRLREARGSADYLAASGTMRSVLVKVVAEDYSDELRSLRCPTAFVWGADDTAAPVSQVARAEELVSVPVTTMVADGVGHDVHHGSPDLLHQAIDHILSEDGK